MSQRQEQWMILFTAQTNNAVVICNGTYRCIREEGGKLLNTLAVTFGGIEPENKPNYYTQHAVECQTFRRHLPLSLAEAAKYRWRAGYKGDKSLDKQKMRWYLRDFVEHRNLLKPIELSTLLNLGRHLFECSDTMDESCASDLKHMTYLAADVQPEVTEAWLARTLNK